MSNVIKFQSPFERIKQYNPNPNIALIKAILLQSIIDSSNNSKNHQARLDEVRAKSWIYGESNDFKKLCEFVSYEVDYVKKLARNIEELHKQDIDKINKKIKTRNHYKNIDSSKNELLNKTVCNI